MMTNKLLDSEKALKLATKVNFIDSEDVSRAFKKIKQKHIQTENIDIKIPRNINRLQIIDNIKINDFIDQFIYYRNLKGYTLDEVGQVIGISGKQYWKYEHRIHKLTNIQKIKKIAEFLEIDEELLLVPKEKLNLNKKELKEYLIENKITNTEFSKQIGISRRSVVDWFNTETEISEKSYKKIRAFLLKLENAKIINRVE